MSDLQRHGRSWGAAGVGKWARRQNGMALLQRRQDADGHAHAGAAVKLATRFELWRPAHASRSGCTRGMDGLRASINGLDLLCKRGMNRHDEDEVLASRRSHARA